MMERSNHKSAHVPDATQPSTLSEGRIIFPTLENVKKLGRSASVSQAFEGARADTIVKVMPRLTKDPDDTLLMELSKEAGYGTVRAPMSALGGGPPKDAEALA
jgi:hypothetical protein